MRRPVKPFVTEYRGGTRRQPGQGLKNDPFKETEPRAPEPWPAPPPVATYAASQQQEDSYEAALRAADSLFAGVRYAADDPQASTEAAATAPSGSGRVLRVLDEPPSQEMREMERREAEFAPKKRGRKPGSKNKPKVAALVALEVVADEDRLADAVASEDAGTAEAVAPLTVVAETFAAETFATAFAASRPVRKAKTTALGAATAIPASSGPRGERYAWVRTRLKPGQQWKRRLPKIAW